MQLSNLLSRRRREFSMVGQYQGKQQGSGLVVFEVIMEDSDNSFGPGLKS